jgi:pheromone a factor receptor
LTTKLTQFTVAVIYRLRKYRSNLRSIISSSSSNLTPSRFLRLFIMSFTLLLLYTPVSIYFFYINVNIDWLSYDWTAIHSPDHWWTIIYLPALGPRTFDCYVPIAMSIFVFFYFGMGGDALEIYRKWMLNVGLGRLFPSLKQEFVRNRKGSWSSRLSLVSRARSYFDSKRKDSATGTSGTRSTDQ